MVKDGRLDADQTAFSYGAAVQHDLMADGHVLAERESNSRIGMQHATVLDVRAVPDGNEVIVSPNHAVEPDAGIVLQHHGSNDRGVIRNPIITASNDFSIAQGINHA